MGVLMNKPFVRSLQANPFKEALPRSTRWEVFFNIEEKVVEKDGSFQIKFGRDSVNVMASTSSVAIIEAKKLVEQWQGAYVTGVRKA